MIKNEGIEEEVSSYMLQSKAREGFNLLN